MLRDKKVFAEARELCLIILQELKCNRLQGQRLQQLKTTLECLKSCSEGMRSTLGGSDGEASPFDKINPFVTAEQILLQMVTPAPALPFLEGEPDDETVIQADLSH